MNAPTAAQLSRTINSRYSHRASDGTIVTEGYVWGVNHGIDHSSAHELYTKDKPFLVYNTQEPIIIPPETTWEEYAEFSKATLPSGDTYYFRTTIF